MESKRKLTRETCVFRLGDFDRRFWLHGPLPLKEGEYEELGPEARDKDRKRDRHDKEKGSAKDKEKDKDKDKDDKEDRRDAKVVTKRRIVEKTKSAIVSENAAEVAVGDNAAERVFQRNGAESRSAAPNLARHWLSSRCQCRRLTSTGMSSPVVQVMVLRAA